MSDCVHFPHLNPGVSKPRAICLPHDVNDLPYPGQIQAYVTDFLLARKLDQFLKRSDNWLKQTLFTGMIYTCESIVNPHQDSSSSDVWGLLLVVTHI